MYFLQDRNMCKSIINSEIPIISEMSVHFLFPISRDFSCEKNSFTFTVDRYFWVQEKVERSFVYVSNTKLLSTFFRTQK